MDTPIPKRMVGRRLNNDVMRPPNYSIARLFIIRPTEDSLFENGVGVTRIIGTETHTTGDGKIVEKW